MHDRVERENIHVTIWAAPDSPHLSDELLTKADALVAAGRALVAGEPQVLDRVSVSRMSVDYAILERARLQTQKKLPVNEGIARLAAARFQPYFDVLQSSRLTHLKEGQVLDKAAYRADLAKDLRITIDK